MRRFQSTEAKYRDPLDKSCLVVRMTVDAAKFGTLICWAF